jgi:hypothetical protein
VPPNDKDIPISRAIGRFFGHLWQAAAKPPPPDKPNTQTVRQSTEQAAGEIDGRPVILRRTTIEEIEFRENPPADGTRPG